LLGHKYITDQMHQHEGEHLNVLDCSAQSSGQGKPGSNCPCERTAAVKVARNMEVERVYPAT
jgi:hypothetical protein